MFTVCTCMFMPWRTEDDFWMPVLFFHMGPSDVTQVIRIEGKPYYPLNHLIIPASQTLSKVRGENKLQVFLLE